MVQNSAKLDLWFCIYFHYIFKKKQKQKQKQKKTAQPCGTGEEQGAVEEQQWEFLLNTWTSFIRP